MGKEQQIIKFYCLIWSVVNFNTLHWDNHEVALKKFVLGALDGNKYKKN